MKQSRDHRDHLDDIARAARMALEFSAGMEYEHFVHDDKTAKSAAR
jgi:uncharacterized protein with HEPN domain